MRGDWTGRLDPWRRNHDVEAHVADYPEDVVHDALAGYYGSITHVDHQIGRLLQIVAEFGLAENTVVAFVSDHGDMMGDHGMWRKGYGYEGSAGVPLILAGPGVPSGLVADRLVELRDLMPTLLDAAGVAIPDQVEGESLLAGLRQEAGWRTHLHGEHVIFGQSMQWIVTPVHKYIWWSGDGHEQLFDLVSDPGECRDLASDPAHAQTLEHCRRLLIAELTGREEGFVADAGLVTGREVSPTLACSREPRP